MTHWCHTRGREVGALLTLAQGWELARAWFTDPREPGWQRRPIAQMAQVVRRYGLSGPFWDLSGQAHVS